MKKFLKIGCGSVFAFFVLIVAIALIFGEKVEDTAKPAVSAPAEEEKIVVEEEIAEEPTVTETPVEEPAKVEEVVTWETALNEIITNSDGPADKFYAVEELVMITKIPVTDEEIANFQAELLGTYKNKTYLADPFNDEVMINLIFKSLVVERNVSGAWKDFAFDYYQNVKYVYRGVDAVDSDAVLSNERQMDKALDKLK